MGVRANYEAIPIVDAARRCGIIIDDRTLGRSEVEAKCPFCGDKSNRYHLSLNTEKDVFRCFLCGETGNSVSLYAKLQSPPVSFGEAARELLSGGKVYPFPQEQRRQNTPPAREPKPIDARHEVFTAMLRHLILSDKHSSDLMERGLSAERINRNMYRSLPESESARRFLAGILSDFYDLDGIPGFFKNNRGEWTISGSSGLLIPFRDMHERIQGLQIRLDNESNPKRKYRWFSSGQIRSGTNGTRSGSWIHVTGNIHSKIAYVTEGGLKGDVASFLDEDALFICFAGVNAIGGLKEVIQSLGVRELVIAGDMDRITNWRVRNGLNNIAKVVLSVRGVKARIGNWNAAFKGIDDYYKVRNIARERGKTMSVQSNDITQYLHSLWKKEYPKQDAGFIDTCEWEEKVIPLRDIIIDHPNDHINLQKVRKYHEQVEAGTVFPPVICVNGFIIDGFHRYHAYKQAEAEYVHVYQNVPWSLESAA